MSISLKSIYIIFVFNLKGNCRKGESCTYAHTEAELRSQPNLRKTKMCVNWKDGT